MPAGCIRALAFSPRQGPDPAATQAACRPYGLPATYRLMLLRSQSHFSLGRPIENQKRWPIRAPLAEHPCPVSPQDGAGLFDSTSHPCAGEKELASRRLPLSGLTSPAHRPTGAPGRAACHPGPCSACPLIRCHRCAGLRGHRCPQSNQKQLGDKEQSYLPSVRRKRHVRSRKPPHNGSEAISVAVAGRTPWNSWKA